MSNVIGQPIDRIDGRAKATGQGLYAGDSKDDNLAYGTIVPAEIGCGRVKSIDAGAARRHPDVLLVMTHENAPAQAPFVKEADARHARPKPQLDSAKVQ